MEREYDYYNFDLRVSLILLHIFIILNTNKMALATLGILSIGDMGLGIAKLLVANNYRVITNATGRRYVGIT